MNLSKYSSAVSRMSTVLDLKQIRRALDNSKVFCLGQVTNDNHAISLKLQSIICTFVRNLNAVDADFVQLQTRKGLISLYHKLVSLVNLKLGFKFSFMLINKVL